MEASLCVLYIKKKKCVCHLSAGLEVLYIVCSFAGHPSADLVSLMVYNPGHFQSRPTVLGGAFWGGEKGPVSHPGSVILCVDDLDKLSTL